MCQKAWDVPDLLDGLVKIMTTTSVKYLTTDDALKQLQGSLSIWALIRHSGTAKAQGNLQPIQDSRNGWRDHLWV